MLEVFYEDSLVLVRRSQLSDTDMVLRESDAKEVWSSNHFTPHEALQVSVKSSVFCLTIIYRGKIAGMCGINPGWVIGNKATILLLGTDDLNKIGFSLIRRSRKIIDMFLGFYPYLENYVHVKNTKSIDWLRWLDANIEEAAPYGFEQELFHHFFFKRG